MLHAEMKEKLPAASLLPKETPFFSLLLSHHFGNKSFNTFEMRKKPPNLLSPCYTQQQQQHDSPFMQGESSENWAFPPSYPLFQS